MSNVIAKLFGYLRKYGLNSPQPWIQIDEISAKYSGTEISSSITTAAPMAELNGTQSNFQ